MNAVLIVITVVQLLVALALVLIVLFQSGKSQGLSALRAGLSTRFKGKSTAKRLRAANDPDGNNGKVA